MQYHQSLFTFHQEGGIRLGKTFGVIIINSSFCVYWAVTEQESGLGTRTGNGTFRELGSRNNSSLSIIDARKKTERVTSIPAVNY